MSAHGTVHRSDTAETPCPFILGPEDVGTSSVRHLARSADVLKQLVRDKGALVLRGFDISDQEHFKDVVRLFSDGELMDYAGGVSPRAKFDDGVYNSTEYPADMRLRLHNEMSYSSLFPNKIFFYCEVEPVDRGETTVGDGRRILAMLDPGIIDEFERRGGVRYERYLTNDPDSPYSWQAAFESREGLRAERICSELGARFEWDELQNLSIYQDGPATLVHPVTGERVWFNQADGFHHTEIDDQTLNAMSDAGVRPRLGSTFADGSPFEREMLDHIREVKTAASYEHRWQRGDCLLLDNILFMHGRSPFAGPRKILVAMS